MEWIIFAGMLVFAAVVQVMAFDTLFFLARVVLGIVMVAGIGMLYYLAISGCSNDGTA